jgi:NitT/TauT family transport system substrate-binding protein
MSEDMRTTRRAFIAAGAATALAGMGQSAVLGQTETKIRVIGVPIDVSAEPYYAKEQGFFKRVGLDAEISTLGNGAQIIAALVGGKVDFGAGGTTSIALAHERGLPIAAVAPAGSYSATLRSHGLVVAADSPIREPKDFLNKTIATAGLKTLGDVALHAWFDKNGLDVAGLKLIEMPYGTMASALAAGRIDGADLEEPYLSAALASGARFVANVFDAIAPQWVEGAYFCTTSYAKTHPDIVRKFADAIAMAATWANRNPVDAWKVLDKYANTTTQTTRQHVLYTERLHVADLQPLIDASAKYGLLQKSFPASDLFAPGISE